MKNIKNLLVKILLGFFVITTLILFINYKGAKDPEPTITSTSLKESLVAVEELTTTKYFYTSMGSFENQNDFYGLKIPLTLKRFIISFEGQINAGVNLENMEIEVEGDKILISLPKAEILSHEIDENSIKIYDEKSSIFNPIKVEDYAAFRQDQKEAREKEALNKGLLSKSETKAKEAIKEILMLIPEVSQSYEIQFVGKIGQ
ncbi:MAG: DUF4230 domain-containing protein [Bacillota bacterium]|nr:DUF4230 domain-containing protein [Bacillota bacterium]